MTFAMRCNFIFAVFSIFLLASCHGANRKIEEAFNLAGDNRAELERVIEYYADDPLKLSAAEFLISNMPGHYSYLDTATVNRYYDEIDWALDSLSGSPRKVIADRINILAEKYNMANQPIVEDVKIIKAEYLIRNIDEAFDQWQCGNWARHLTFDEFCEYLLPYKVEEMQPLDDWRNRYGNFHADSLYELDYCDMFRRSSYSAAVRLNRNLSEVIKPFSWNVLNCPPKRIETLFSIPFGRCDDYAWMTAAIFRSVGIPVTVDVVPHWAYRSLGHRGNAVIAPTGKPMMFSGMSSGPEHSHHVDERIAKMFRVSYARNEEIEKLHEEESYIPDVFKSVFLRDVTDQYIAVADVEIPLDKRHGGYVYLCVYGDNDWTPVDFVKAKGGEASFHDIGKDVMYIIARYDHNGAMETLTEPFVIGPEGNINYIMSDTSDCQSVTLYRKYPVIEYVHKYAKLINEGEFEASDDPDFKNAVSVHKITDGAAVGHKITLPDSIKPYRYWRYIQRHRNAHCNMGEIFFFGEEGNRLKGAVIGTKGHRTIYEGQIRDKLFDNDLLTSFNSPNPNGDWGGMDFGKPVKVSKIIFYGRGDGNTVEIGDRYELFFWQSGCWHSLGRQEANDVSLTYDNVPKNALLLLRDLTKGKDERIFTIEETGRQQWW